MATNAQLKSEIAHIKKLMKTRYNSIMRELGKTQPDGAYVREKLDKLADDADAIMHDKHVLRRHERGL